MHLKSLSGGPPPEEPAMGGQPPSAGALALAFVPGKALIDRIQRSDPDLDRSPNRARAIGAIEQDDVTPDNRRRLAVRARLAAASGFMFQSSAIAGALEWSVNSAPQSAGTRAAT